MNCHAAIEEVPPEALLRPHLLATIERDDGTEAEMLIPYSGDFELRLAHAPLVETDTGCHNEACESEEACTCDE